MMPPQAHAATPPTPIPVMITAPEDSPSRRGSGSQPGEPRRKFATFYTLDEVNECFLKKTHLISFNEFVLAQA